MSLIVVLINWQDEQQTLQCVRNIRGWHVLKPDILVVDNQSTESSRDRLRRDLTTDELICHPANRGYAGGNNLGIQQALRTKQDYILLLNTDAEIPEAGMTRLLARLESNPDISILGPVIFEGQNDQMHCLIGGRDIAKHQLTRIAVEPDTLTSIAGYPLHDVDYVPGAVFLTRRTVFEEIGLLDEQYFFSGEIADFCKRAKVMGHKSCADLEVQAYHYTDKTAFDLRESLYVYYSLRNRFLYIKKHYPLEKFRYFSYWIQAGILQFAMAIVKRRTRKARAIFMALKHALLNQFGDRNDQFL